MLKVSREDDAPGIIPGIDGLGDLRVARPYVEAELARRGLRAMVEFREAGGQFCGLGGLGGPGSDGNRSGYGAGETVTYLAPNLTELLEDKVRLRSLRCVFSPSIRFRAEARTCRVRSFQTLKFSLAHEATSLAQGHHLKAAV